MNEIIIAILRSGTPLIYVTLAGVIAQRAGVWNLGLEGLMIMGACATIVGIMLTNSIVAAILIAILICVLASVLLWFVIDRLKANPIIAGLGLTGLGLGGTALAVQSIFGSQASVTAPFGIPKLGPAFGAYGVLSIAVAAMPFVVFGMWVMLRRTRFGLRLAACGEHPFAARSVGANPSRMRLVALAIGGVLVCHRRGGTCRRQPAVLRPGHDGGSRLHGLCCGHLRRFPSGGGHFRCAVLRRRWRARYPGAIDVRRQDPARPSAGFALSRDCLRRLAFRQAARRREGRQLVRRTQGSIGRHHEVRATPSDPGCLHPGHRR
ncbi:ABC transporter permease subunit [Sinorhizobium meliloti]|uniref:ABC transporter permease subunit n=1 Tax=Rhizobium meliloti TaxID=382 RepID=UPI00299ECCB0